MAAELIRDHGIFDPPPGAVFHGKHSRRVGNNHPGVRELIQVGFDCRTTQSCAVGDLGRRCGPFSVRKPRTATFA